MTSKFGSTQEAAEAWGVGRSTVFKWIAEGRIVSFQPGGKNSRHIIPLDQFLPVDDEDAA